VPGPIVILAIGSRGDVQPRVILGRELQSRGYPVRVLTSDRYARIVNDAGLEFFPLGVDMEAMIQSADWRFLHDGQRPAGLTRTFSRIVLAITETVLAEVTAGCAGAEAILTSSWGAVGYPVAESYGIPCAFLSLHPGVPTHTFPHLEVSPERSLGKLANRASYVLAEQRAWKIIRSRINHWCTHSLGLPPMPMSGPSALTRRLRLPVLCGFSVHVVPRPPDWGPHVHPTGYWLPKFVNAWTPPQTLADFLDAGPPPVYVGFGSWLPKDSQEVHRLACAALRHAGVRGILHGNPTQAESPGLYGEDIFVVDDVPHQWLFARMAAVVHHGGAGTTAQALHADAPNVVCPFVRDQRFWGARVAALGAGPRPVPIRHLRAEALGEAISQAVTDPRIRSAAASLGLKLRAEDGTKRACDLIEGWLREPFVPGNRKHS
jgi:sterol 3beta-glucosyltransferase